MRIAENWFHLHHSTLPALPAHVMAAAWACVKATPHDLPPLAAGPDPRAVHPVGGAGFPSQRPTCPNLARREPPLSDCRVSLSLFLSLPPACDFHLQALRFLEAQLLVADAATTLTVSGNGDVLEPPDGVMGECGLGVAQGRARCGLGACG